METVTLYREIGKILHQLGAYRAVLVNSKATPGQNCEMYLEIAVDGAIDLNEASKCCKENWEHISIKLLDLNNYENIELMREVIEDGVQL